MGTPLGPKYNNFSFTSSHVFCLPNVCKFWYISSIGYIPTWSSLYSQALLSEIRWVLALVESRSFEAKVGSVGLKVVLVGGYAYSPP